MNESTKQVRHRAVAKRRGLFNQRLDWPSILRVNRRCRLHGLVVHRAARYAEPAAQFGNRDRNALSLKSLSDGIIISLPCPTGTGAFFERVTPTSPRHRLLAGL